MAVAMSYTLRRLSPLTIRYPISCHVTYKTTRFFSVSSPRRSLSQSELPSESTQHNPVVAQSVDEVNYLSCKLLDAIHNTGLPWWAVVITSAVLVRGVVGYYFISQIHRSGGMKETVMPLLFAKNRATQCGQLTEDIVKKAVKPKSLQTRTEAWQAQYMRISGVERTLQQLAAKTGIELLNRPETFIFWLAQPMMFIWMVDGIVRKCGQTKTARDQLDLVGYKVSALSEPSKIVTTIDHEISSANSSDKGDMPPVSSSAQQSGLDYSTLDPALDMQLEGLPWCEDLTLPDPTGILQFTLLAIMLARVLVKPGRTLPQDIKQFREHFTSVDGFMILLAIVYYNFRDYASSAVTLYLITSILLARMQATWLHFRYPRSAIIKPCKLMPNQRVSHISLPGRSLTRPSIR